MSTEAAQVSKTCSGHKAWIASSSSWKNANSRHDLEALDDSKKSNNWQSCYKSYGPLLFKPGLQQPEIFIQLQFEQLASDWKNAVQIISDWNLMVLHPSYQRIIGLGPDVIPCILKDLEQNGGHWFWALRALTGENPVADEDAGRVRKMTEAWLNWGRLNGYI